MELFGKQNFAFNVTFCNNNNKIDIMICKLESKPFLFFFRDHLRSTLGITFGRGSFAVHFGDHLRSRDHLRYCTVLYCLRRPINRGHFYLKIDYCNTILRFITIAKRIISKFVSRVMPALKMYIEDITRWREDMNFIFEWQNNILRTSAASE